MDDEHAPEEYLSTKEARKLLSVSIDTLRSWDKQGKINTIRTPSGFRMYSKSDIYNILGCTLDSPKKKKVCYARVSSKKQEDDLLRQKSFFEREYPDYLLVTDIGSGINWKRKGLNRILDLAIKGDLEELVVAHKDRLSRFAFELIESIISKTGGKVVVLDRSSEKSENEELADDILSIIHVDSCRANGKRRYTSNKSKENQSIPKSNTE
jgi:predicted site-specific integrase-resolvase